MRLNSSFFVFTIKCYKYNRSDRKERNREGGKEEEHLLVNFSPSWIANGLTKANCHWRGLDDVNSMISSEAYHVTQVQSACYLNTLSWVGQLISNPTNEAKSNSMKLLGG